MRRLGWSVTLFCVMLALFAAPAAAAPDAAPGAVPRATLEQYKEWMREAREKHPYRESVDKMYRVMMCESVGDARALGGGGRWKGLFQYVTSTWKGAWNPYRAADIFDAKAQIFATAHAWSRGMQNHWTCYKLTR